MSFPKFWYEGNLYFGYVSSLEDLKKVFKNYEGHENVDALLDKSKNNPDSDDDYFGLRRECNGTKTLREFLVEKGINAVKCGSLSIDSYVLLLDIKYLVKSI